MKKFLFTLASLVGLGFAANAAAPVMAFTAGANSTEPITEITMAPGETMEIGFCILSTDEAIKGWQTNFEMRKPDGTLYIGTEKGTEVWDDFSGVNYLVQTPMGIPGIHFEFLQDYGNEDKWEWFKQVNSISSNANNTVSNSNGANKQTSAYDADGAYMPGNAYGVDNVDVLYTGMANLIMTNGATGTCFPKRGATFPWTVIVFTITTEQNWSEEYAEIVMTKADYVYASGQQVGEFLTLKINNSAPQTADANPLFTWDGDNYTMTISEGTLYLDGEAVASPYVVEKADADRLLHFSAKNGNSDLVYYNVIVPAGEGAEPAEKAQTPVINVTGTDYAKTVTITAEEGATIYYSTDGGVTYGEYTEALTFNTPGDYTVDAYAVGPNGKTQSDNAEQATFTLIEEPLPTLGGYFVWTQTGNKFQVEYHNTDLEDQGYVFTIEVKDPNGNVVEPVDGFYGDLPEGESTWTATVTTTGYQPKSEDHPFTYHEPTYAPTPTIVWNQETLTVEAYVLDENNQIVEGYNVVLMANGTEIENPKTYTQTTTEQRYDFSAYTEAKDEDNNSAIVYYSGNTVVIPAQAVQTPAPTIALDPYEDDDEYVYVRATGEGEVTLFYDGEEVDNPYKVKRPAYDYDGQMIMIFSATAHVEGQIDGENTGTAITIPKMPEPQIEDLTGELIISDCTEGLHEEGPGGYFTVTYNGPETVEIAVTYETGAKAALEPNADGKYRLPDYGTYDVKAVASATGYNDKEDTKTLVWRQPASAPATEIEVTINPDGTVTITADGNNPVITGPTTFDRPSSDEGDQQMTVTVTTTDDGCTPTTVDLTFTIPAMLPEPIINHEEGKTIGVDENAGVEGATEPNWHVYVDGHYIDITFTPVSGGTIQYSTDGVTWTDWDGQPIHNTQNGDYTYYAREIVNGDISEVAQYDFTIDENTGVEELMNGKTVANVRYFNLAGQEMQEANGMTIVVTTYTDGTRSAVKVMK